MASMADMVEAHLMNVQREIGNLNERKNAIDKEIEKLQQYLQEGQTTLLEYRSAIVAKPVQQPALVTPSIFNP